MKAQFLDLNAAATILGRVRLKSTVIKRKFSISCAGGACLDSDQAGTGNGASIEVL